MPDTEQECLILRIVLILQASECYILCGQKEWGNTSQWIIRSIKVMVSTIQFHFTSYTLHKRKGNYALFFKSIQKGFYPQTS